MSQFMRFWYLMQMQAAKAEPESVHVNSLTRAFPART